MLNINQMTIPTPQELDKPKKGMSPSDVDKITIIHKTIESVFNVLPLDETGLYAWVAVLGACKKEYLGEALKHWIATEPKAPKPADLLRVYKDQRAEAAKEFKNKATRETLIGEVVYKCPYCRDTGWMFIDRGNGYDTVSDCVCTRSNAESDLASIKRNGWEFDYKKRAWCKTVWLGDVM